MSKEQVIKKAWGEYYEKIKNRLDKNGWYNYFSLTQKVMKEKYHQFDNLDLEVHTELYLLRPKSLQGIEKYYSFVDIKGFENYQVNKQGIVISKSRVSIQKNGKRYTVKEKVMKPQIDNTGYIVFGLRCNTGTKKVYLHRILCESFKPNPNNLPCVNHKNGVKYDNSLSNLEWCTYKENNIHAFDNNLNTTIGHRLKGKKGSECHNYGKRKKVYSDNKVYNNVIEASTDLGVTVGYLYKCLCGAVPNKYNLSYQPIEKPKPPIY